MIFDGETGEPVVLVYALGIVMTCWPLRHLQLQRELEKNKLRNEHLK